MPTHSHSRAPRPPEHTHTHAPPSNAALFHSATHTTCTRASTRVHAPAASSVLAAASRVTRRRRYCRRHCAAALLLHHDVDDVAVLHVELLRRLVGVDAVAVEEEAHAVHRDAVAVAEGLQGESTGECEQRSERERESRRRRESARTVMSFWSGVVSLHLKKISLPSCDLAQREWSRAAVSAPKKEHGACGVWSCSSVPA